MFLVMKREKSFYRCVSLDINLSIFLRPFHILFWVVFVYSSSEVERPTAPISRIASIKMRQTKCSALMNSSIVHQFPIALSPFSDRFQAHFCSTAAVHVRQRTTQLKAPSILCNLKRIYVAFVALFNRFPLKFQSLPFATNFYATLQSFFVYKC